MNALLQCLRRHWLLLMLLLWPTLAAAAAAAEPAPIPSPSLPVAEAADAADDADDATRMPAAFSEFQQMLERPIFSSTRRPPVFDDALPDNLDAKQLREVWRLSGIALEQGRQLALFSERQGERRLLLEVGMLLADDWRLEHIGSDRVLFSNASGEVEMPLREPIIAPEPSAEPPVKKAAGKPAPRHKNVSSKQNSSPTGKPVAAAPAKK
jgi:hypothetical protein